MKYNIAVDLGTANVVIYIVGHGIVLREPSVAAVTTKGRRKVVAVGEEAARMLGKTPEGIEAVKPLRDGVIADFRITEDMLKLYVKKALNGKRAGKKGHSMVICVPCNINSAEHKAVKDAAKKAGAKISYIAEESVAAAIGAGMEIDQPRGCMIVDIGGGTSDVALLSIGGLVGSKSLRCGGVKMDEAIVSYVRKNYNMIIGEKTSEKIKMEIGSAMADIDEGSIKIRGRDNISGLPMTVEVTSREICYALDKVIKEIILAIRGVLEDSPPEILSDVMQHGIVLTGGGSLLKNFESRVEQDTNIKARIAENPMDCVALGAGIIVEELSTSKYKKK